MNNVDTRPTVAAKAGDWVELRDGAVTGPLREGTIGRFPILHNDDADSWSETGKNRIAESRDIVAIVPRPQSLPQLADRHANKIPEAVPTSGIVLTRHMGFNAGFAVEQIWKARNDVANSVELYRSAIRHLEDEIERLREFDNFAESR